MANNSSKVQLPAWEVVQTLRGHVEAVQALHTFDEYIASGGAALASEVSCRL